MGDVVDLHPRCLCCEGRKRFRAYIAGKHVDILCALCGGTGKRPPEAVVERWRAERQAKETEHG